MRLSPTPIILYYYGYGCTHGRNTWKPQNLRIRATHHRSVSPRSVEHLCQAQLPRPSMWPRTRRGAPSRLRPHASQLYIPVGNTLQSVCPGDKIEVFKKHLLLRPNPDFPALDLSAAPTTLSFSIYVHHKKCRCILSPFMYSCSVPRAPCPVPRLPIPLVPIPIRAEFKPREELARRLIKTWQSKVYHPPVSPFGYQVAIIQKKILITPTPPSVPQQLSSSRSSSTAYFTVHDMEGSKFHESPTHGFLLGANVPLGSPGCPLEVCSVPAGASRQKKDASSGLTIRKRAPLI